MPIKQITAADDPSSVRSAASSAAWPAATWPASQPAFLRFEDLSKSYQEGDRTRVVLQNADAEFAQGEFVAILGRSGSGKSTLLNLLSGIDRADSGRLWLGGQELSALDDRQRTLFRRRNIGFVFQFFNLIPTLTVWENVVLPLELNGAARPKSIDALSRCWRLWDCWTAARPSPTGCPAANSSASPWPAPWCMTPCWCWPTSRPATWTRTPANRYWRCWTV